MIDMSRSMFYSDCFTAAKRIALALDALIRSNTRATRWTSSAFRIWLEELKPADLPALSWNKFQYGTNMQHGFQLARKLLARQKGANRQIIIITDGEPTVIHENGHVFFNWPTMPKTFQETLKEVIRCTKDGITINTFMLERTPDMIRFVNDLMRINTGRVFMATPDQLGEYILADYVANKQKFVSTTGMPHIPGDDEQRNCTKSGRRYAGRGPRGSGDARVAGLGANTIVLAFNAWSQQVCGRHALPLPVRWWQPPDMTFARRLSLAGHGCPHITR